MNRKELKGIARMRMSQSDPGYLSVMLLWVLAAVLVPQVLVSAVSAPLAQSLDQFSELLIGGIDPDLALRALQLSSGQIFSSAALNLVLWIYQLVMSFGLTLYCLRLYRGDPCGPPELFYGFSMPGRVVGAQLLVTLIAVACAIALAIPLTVAMVAFIIFLPETPAIILAAVLWTAYIAVLVAVMLSYALTTCALADQPGLGAMGAIQYGKNLIRGHRGEYFVLILSFLGWALLCSLLSGVFTAAVVYLELPVPAWASGIISVVLLLPNYLWLTPYVNTTIAGFYTALQGQGFRPEFPPAL